MAKTHFRGAEPAVSKHTQKKKTFMKINVFFAWSAGSASQRMFLLIPRKTFFPFPEYAQMCIPIPGTYYILDTSR